MGTACPAKGPAPCQERERLELDHRTAGEVFDKARAVMRQRVGRCLRSEYLSLDRAADQAWERLQQCRNALEAHVREHNCGPNQARPAFSEEKFIW